MKRPRIFSVLPEWVRSLVARMKEALKLLLGQSPIERLFSFKPLDWIRRYPIEISLLTCGVVTAVLAVVVLTEPMLQRRQSDLAMQAIMTAIEQRVSASVDDGNNDTALLFDFNPSQTSITIPIVLTADAELDVYGDAYDYADALFEQDINARSTPQNTVEGIGILSIESIDLSLPVIEGATKQGLKAALGHVTGTAKIGEVGNAVIAGHRSYTYGRFFNRLDEVSVGDAIHYTACTGEVFTYTVYDISVIEPDDPTTFDELLGEGKLTLVTCTPVRVASHRLLVRAVLVEKTAHITAVNTP